MGDAFIVRRGGGGKLFAAIAVTYPQGSTCTCTNGTKTLRAKDTSGSYLFVIPESGTWTVSCTDGTQTASRVVNITAQYQAESVTLVYELWIVTNGVQNIVGESATGGLTATAVAGSGYLNISTPGNNSDSTGYAWHVGNIANYNTLHFEFEGGADLGEISWGISADKTVSTNTWAAMRGYSRGSSRTTGQIDITAISSLPSDVYVKTLTWTKTTNHTYVYNLWID